MHNHNLAKLLYEIADYLEIQNIAYKPRAYRRAAQTIESLQKDIAFYAKQGTLQSLPGIGAHIAEKIEEFLKTGKIKHLSELKKKIPFDVEGLTRIPGMGPKTAKLLHEKLKIKTVADLKRAAKAGKLQKLQGLGQKTEQHIVEAADTVKKERTLLSIAQREAQEVIDALQKAPGIQQVTIAGSLRRMRTTVADLDVLATAKQPEKIMNLFTSMPAVTKVLAKGPSKASVKLNSGLQADLRVVDKKSFGAALQYFTGSKQHNVRLRNLAKKKGYKLNEYGLFRGEQQIAGSTEEAIYKKVGCVYIPPELREDAGEIEAAQQKKLPVLVEHKAIKGDFHMHTTASDGRNSLSEMVTAATQKRYKFIAITDHIGNIPVARPLDAKRIAAQAKEIRTANKKTNLHIFHGGEVDITKTGELAMNPEVLKTLDVVGASIHSSFRMSKKEMTKRLFTALDNRYVTMLCHPSGRHLGKRPSIEADWGKIYDKAKERNVFLEINGTPVRLDLPDVMVREAKQHGVRFSLGTDAHTTMQLDQMEFGVGVARRGWLEKKDILNTYPLARVKKLLSR